MEILYQFYIELVLSIIIDIADSGVDFITHFLSAHGEVYLI